MPDQGHVATADATFRLMYRSRSRLASTDQADELGHLFTTARSRNKQQRITGALLVTRERFVQVLEGEEDKVRTLFGLIERDPRHEAVELLSAGVVGERAFAHWSMAKVSADGDTDIPLIATVGEFSPAAVRATSAEQQHQLDVMRQAADPAPAA